MPYQTFIHVDNTEIVEAFKTVGATLSQVLNDHFVSNWTLKDVQSRSDLDPTLKPVKINPVVTEGPEPVVGPIEFDPAVDVIQQIDQRWFQEFREKHGSLFPVPVEEPAPAPRYKVKMTQEEFARDLLKKEEWAAIETLAQTNALVGAWRDITISGEVWVGHADFIEGMELAVSLGIFTTERANDIKQGLLIQ